MYSSYARSHLYYAAELLLLAVLLLLVETTVGGVAGGGGAGWMSSSASGQCLQQHTPAPLADLLIHPAHSPALASSPLVLLFRQSYAGIAWSTWMVSVAILWSPFWFNPQTFQLEVLSGPGLLLLLLERRGGRLAVLSSARRGLGLRLLSTCL